MTLSYATPSLALIGLADRLMSTGEEVTVRGSRTRELVHQHVVIERPTEREILVPARHNDPFATIAETLWVIAGRDDLEFLNHYLPRAARFSDDGVRWRGGYGPRLRNWNGVDQVQEVTKLLRRDRSTRRAVVQLFDPARDFVDSLDIPCTNWLHFLIRDDRLEMAVVLRSNDLVWGFSGINAFEWSVLQEMVAHWVGVEAGPVSYFMSSLHVYDRHWPRARTIAASRVVEPQGAPSPCFNTSLDLFDGVLERWFELEAAVRGGARPLESIEAFPDPLLREFLRMLLAYWSFRRGELDRAIADVDRAQGGSSRTSAVLYFRWRTGADDPPSPHVEPSILDGLSRLHAAKDAVYGDSWKRRGELLSILPNIARKLDRLELDRTVDARTVESLLDTAADLVVYAVKYKTYLLDAQGAPPPAAHETWSDGTAGVDAVLDDLALPASTDFVAALARCIAAFSALFESARVNDPSIRRLADVDELIRAALVILRAQVERNPEHWANNYVDRGR